MKTNTNSDSELKSRSAQHRSDKLPKIDFRQRFYNRTLPTPKVLEMLHDETPRFWELCQVVGRWVWIQFEHKQPSTVTMELAQLGFHWNRRRQVWQHPCGTVTPSSNQDPRRRYRTYFPADLTPA